MLSVTLQTTPVALQENPETLQTTQVSLQKLSVTLQGAPVSPQKQATTWIALLQPRRHDGREGHERRPLSRAA